MRAVAGSVLLILLVGCKTAPVKPRESSRCDRVVSLCGAGEHKPALDELTELERQGIVCRDEVRAAAERSVAKVKQADSLIKAAQGKRAAGDLAGARESLDQALVVYPKYYWAKKQLLEVERAIASEVEGFKLRAEQLESAGNLQAAVDTYQRVLSLVPGDADVQQRIIRLRGPMSEKKLGLARAAESRGELAAAADLLMQAIDTAPAGSQLRMSLVDYARLLGLKLFSGGELTRARDLWLRGLTLEPGDEKLRDYLEEVKRRLESLERIKAKEDGSDPH